MTKLTKRVLMKCMAVAVFVVFAGSAFAQDLERLTPKEMPSGEKKPEALPQTPPPEVTQDKGEKVLLKNLAGLVFVSSPDKVIPKGLTQRGVVVDGYQEQEFFQQMNMYLGKPLTLNGLNEILKKVVLYFRATDRPVVDVYAPEQDISGGTVQIVVLEGKLGQVKTEGNRWFSDHLFTDKIRVKPGEVVYGKKLLEDLDWINNNPFRQTDLVFARGSNPGETDIILRTQDRFPVRVFTGYEDSGTDLTGKARLLAGLNWGNVFGIDHQLNYQFTASPDFDKFKAHSVSYQVPLPWRHTLTLMGAYAESKPDIGNIFNQKGKSWEIDGRYTIPLAGFGNYTHSIQTGIDFKYSDNNLDFSQVPVFDKKTQIFQWMIGYNGALPDRLGSTSIGGNLYYSPGGLTTYNKDSYFNDLTPGAKAEYVYFQLNAERLTHLPADFAWDLRINTQIASNTLLDSEKMGLGGYNTVRGYDERDVNGDGGYLVVNEVRTPAIDLAGHKFGVLQFLAFVDYGYSTNHDTSAQKNTSLSSTGLGFRYNLGSYISARFDYGWQLKKLDNGNTNGSRAHVGIVAAL